jgi:integrase
MGVFKRTRISKQGKKTDYWYMRYVINGKETWKSAGKVGEITKTVAQKMLEDIKRSIRMGTYQYDVKNITLESLEKDYINYVKNISQIRTWDKRVEHMNTLKAFFGDKELINYTSKDIDDFKSYRLKKVKPATVNRELASLRHIFNQAKRWKKFFGDNPVSVSGLLREDNLRKRVLSLDEEERLLQSSSQHLIPIIMTALYTALRRSEILSLVWENVDFNNNIIIITTSNNKSKKEKTVPLNSALRKLLLELKLKNSSVSEYVFLDNKGNNIKGIKTAFVLLPFSQARFKLEL